MPVPLARALLIGLIILLPWCRSEAQDPFEAGPTGATTGTTVRLALEAMGEADSAFAYVVLGDAPLPNWQMGTVEQLRGLLRACDARSVMFHGVLVVDCTAPAQPNLAQCIASRLPEGSETRRVAETIEGVWRVEPTLAEVLGEVYDRLPPPEGITEGKFRVRLVTVAPSDPVHDRVRAALLGSLLGRLAPVPAELGGAIEAAQQAEERQRARVEAQTPAARARQGSGMYARACQPVSVRAEGTLTTLLEALSGATGIAMRLTDGADDPSAQMRVEGLPGTVVLAALCIAGGQPFPPEPDRDTWVLGARAVARYRVARLGLEQRAAALEGLETSARYPRPRRPEDWMPDYVLSHLDAPIRVAYCETWDGDAKGFIYVAGGDAITCVVRHAGQAAGAPEPAGHERALALWSVSRRFPVGGVGLLTPGRARHPLTLAPLPFHPLAQEPIQQGYHPPTELRGGPVARPEGG